MFNVPQKLTSSQLGLLHVAKTENYRNEKLSINKKPSMQGPEIREISEIN